MLTDKQFWRIKQLNQEGKTQESIADRVGINRETVSNSLKESKAPSQRKKVRVHRTRIDAFATVWDLVAELLTVNPGLEVKTIFKELKKRSPGEFQDGQIRTLQRRIQLWRLEHGPEKEIFFEQTHEPGVLCASDYTHMDKLNITIQHQPFNHLLYHFVLTYSNWETITICFSESFESLSEGLQNAFWELGGIPQKHRSDNLSAAVKNFGNDKGEMTSRYKSLLKHYKINRSKIQPRKPNENGDVEKSNHLIKKAIDQQLMLRGSRDFESKREYEIFLKELLSELNSGRTERLKDEKKELLPLPSNRLADCTDFHPTVSPHSTIKINKSTYSVKSQMKGLKPTVKQYASYLEVWYANTLLETLPRTFGKKDEINYHHLIGSLVRKPGAFEDFKYKEEMFPTSYFREAYDYLVKYYPRKSSSEYLKILHLAAMNSEVEVNLALKQILDNSDKVSLHAVMEIATSPQNKSVLELNISEVNLERYDSLYSLDTLKT